MRTRIVKKLHNGLASIRDYEYEKAKKEGLKLSYGGETMTLKPENLYKFQAHRTKIASKINYGQYYELIDFKWRPDNAVEQLELF